MKIKVKNEKDLKSLSEKLDNTYIIKLIENSESPKALGKAIKNYYNYIKNNS
jgi:hypothetical protein|tara:strand:- start:464 stop:619 length:156 start_codon:yes stop_codon:yes gene_type:complete